MLLLLPRCNKKEEKEERGERTLVRQGGLNEPENASVTMEVKKSKMTSQF